ncbi:hypothetical protein PQX77_006021 [Marasmius sp. AFHP31]|nr:hypothetical protein PQX77_006021 [Marasmius sp. AFHP31]
MPYMRQARYSVAENVQIFCSDTGPPPSNDYTTLVFLHGSLFYGGTFDTLFDHAHQHDVRIVSLNRREYPGSTPYSRSELEELHEGRKLFLDRLALHLARFLKAFVEEQEIPPISNDRKRGGIVIVGWSMGCVTSMTLLSSPDVLFEGLYNLLERYLKGLVLYDPPEIAFGYDIPQPHSEVSALYHPWSDTTSYATPEEGYRKKFLPWISSSFQHDLTQIHAGWRDLKGFDGRKRAEHCLADAWSDEYLQKYTDLSAAARSERPMYGSSMKSTIREMTGHVLFDGKLRQSFFPQLEVLYLWGTCSPWTCIWARMEIERLTDEHIKEGSPGRSITFLELKELNHFAHLKNPRGLLEIVLGWSTAAPHSGNELQEVK